MYLVSCASRQQPARVQHTKGAERRNRKKRRVALGALADSLAREPGTFSCSDATQVQSITIVRPLDGAGEYRCRREYKVAVNAGSVIFRV